MTLNVNISPGSLLNGSLEWHLGHLAGTCESGKYCSSLYHRQFVPFWDNLLKNIGIHFTGHLHRKNF